MELLKSHGKSHGNSWNFNRSNVYEPCIDTIYTTTPITLSVSTDSEDENREIIKFAFCSSS